MPGNGVGDYFISDVDDDLYGDDDLAAPVIVPAAAPPAAPQSPAAPATAGVAPAAPPRVAPAAPAPAPAAPAAAASAPAVTPAPAQPAASAAPEAPEVTQPAAGAGAAEDGSREDRLVRALDSLMHGSVDIQAAALVSLDGFTMASALPDGMQEDRVGAMSAAILGLGERAAAELGRGKLSQVFIEGDSGYVLLMSAGDRAVLTCLADRDAKLGLVLYDMRSAAEEIGRVLG